MTFDKQIKRRDLLKASAMLGIAGAAGSTAPSLLMAEPA
ncbi:MAG: twin-arginine translocation signal domain-containing protein, partial [Deltaproteobacteria bacterium]|nr:twin-arginine translocation signal domain-containing protein [Deltaproteobacteria bacterium]